MPAGIIHHLAFEYHFNFRSFEIQRFLLRGVLLLTCERTTCIISLDGIFVRRLVPNKPSIRGSENLRGLTH